MSDPFTPSDRFSVELVGPVEVTSTVTAGIASVTVTQGPCRWTFYDRASIDAHLDGIMRAAVVLEVAQADTGECGVCGKDDVPLCDTVPKWINDGADRESIARCFACCEEMDTKASAA